MELWDIYDKDRVFTGKTMVRGEKIKDGDHHIVVHACVFNSCGKMLIQQRQPFKEGWPNMWDVTVGGSAVSGDTSGTAVERELFEELGLVLDLKDTRPHLTINFNGGFDDIYLACKDVDISTLSLQYEEVQAVRWADIDEIFEMIDSGTFIPYHKSLIQLLFDMRHYYGAAKRKNYN